MSKYTYQAIESLSDAELKQAYAEIREEKLPKDCLVRQLQSKLYEENKKVVALSSVQYHVAMEMLKRFYD